MATDFVVSVTRSWLNPPRLLEPGGSSLFVPRIIGTVIGLCVGIVLFYLPAAHAACDWFWPASNLCGLPAVMIAAPIGAVVGGIVGWRLTGRWTLRDHGIHRP